MAKREHDEQLAVPIYLDDDSVLTDSELVCLYGAEARQEPSRVGRYIVELASDSLFHVLVERAVLRGRQLSEFDPEGQDFISLSSSVPKERSCPLGPGVAPRRFPQSSRR